MLPRVIVQHRVHARASSFSSLLCSKIDQLTMARPLDRILRSETSERDSSSWNERRADSCKRARQTFFSFPPVNRIHAVLSLQSITETCNSHPAILSISHTLDYFDNRSSSINLNFDLFHFE